LTMDKRTEYKTKGREAAETAYLSTPDPTEGAACLAQALAEEGVPEDAARKAANAFGDSLKITRAAWRSTQLPDDEVPSEPEKPAMDSLSPRAKALLLALVKQKNKRPHKSGWIRIDKESAKADAGLLKLPDSVYEETLRELIVAGCVSLRVVTGKTESLPCFRLEGGEASK
jgi:hypothetical protein